MTAQITINQNADGTCNAVVVDGDVTLTFAGATATINAAPASVSTPVSTSPAPVSPPPPPPPAPIGTLAAAVITGTVNGSPVNLTVQPGQRVQLVPGNFQCGCAWYAADGSLLYQNDYAGAGNPTPIDLPMSLTAVVGGQTFTTGSITLCYRQWTRPFWIVEPTAKTFDRSLFPYYGLGAETASFVDAYAKADNSILGPGLHDPHTADTGERGDLGLLTGPDAAALTNPSDAANAVVRGQADASAPFPFHATDTTTGEMLLASDYPRASMLPACYGAGNPFVKFTTSCTYSLSEAQAHAPAFNALAAAMYGTEFDKASLAQWANYIGCLWQNWGYRITPDGPTCLDKNVQTRGAAWALRTLAEAAKLSDHPDLFSGWIEAQASQIPSITAKAGMPMLLTDVVYPNNGFAPYQIDFVQSAVGYAIQLGFTSMQPLLDYLEPLMSARMLDAPHEFACIYEASYKDASGNVAKDWPTVLQFTAVNQPKIAAALQCAEDSVEMQSALYGLPAGQMPAGVQEGDFTGYPTSPNGTGYSAIYRSGSAYTAKFATNQARAQAAWTKFLKYDREIYATDPKYDEVQGTA